MQFTLLTLNLAGFKHWKSREATAIKVLNRADADIVFLQEVMYNPAISPLSQGNYVNSLLEYPYKHSVSDVSRFYAPGTGEPYREGLAILSKFPLNNTETLALNKAPDDKHTRIIQTVDANIEGTSLRLTNVHFSNNQHSNEQLQETLRIVEARGKENMIAGDFNIFDITEQRSFFEGIYSASTDFMPYISFPSENATLDYILLPKTFRFVSIKTLPGASDHAGVLAVIEL